MMKEQIDVLYVGDSEFECGIFIKGFNAFFVTDFHDDSHWLKDALLENPSIKVTHMQCHAAVNDFPRTTEELKRFHVLILSDVGSDTLVIYPGKLPPYRVPLGPNRLEAIEGFVHDGGGFIMVGGYLSFAGLHGMAKYHDTPVEKCLPVDVLPYDDRVEVPQGFTFKVTKPDHPIMAGIPWKEADFQLLGYNKLTLKNGASLLAEYKGDPVIAVWEYGKGRSMVFASDPAPHWVGNFKDWKYYSKFWVQAVKWLAGMI
ncbi:MAG: glutamine amidotransferase [Candidatus Bathyarchaeia archaeon]